jgi:hypothetical protein
MDRVEIEVTWRVVSTGSIGLRPCSQVWVLTLQFSEPLLSVLTAQALEGYSGGPLSGHGHLVVGSGARRCQYGLGAQDKSELHLHLVGWVPAASPMARSFPTRLYAIGLAFSSTSSKEVCARSTTAEEERPRRVSPPNPTSSTSTRIGSPFSWEIPPTASSRTPYDDRLSASATVQHHDSL